MAVLTSTHNLYFEQKYEKCQNFFIGKFSIFGGKMFGIIEQACFCNGCLLDVLMSRLVDNASLKLSGCDDVTIVGH